jgi:uncharacterized protein YjbI with pentapeptide repeats
MKLFTGQRVDADARPTWRPIPAWIWMLAAVTAVVVATLVVTTWLLTIASSARSGTDLANARLDAVRTGLAAGAGAGAAVGLMLAFRRQHHQEIATVLTDLDATERRITELYTKAVEQLGSDKAPVRLGGLYALERLAQDNPAHRQTIVNVICAYLRMPFTYEPLSNKPLLETSDAEDVAPAETEMAPIAVNDTWQQERQVRLTAQSILSSHLSAQKRGEDPLDERSRQFWPGINVDLSGATLIDFNFLRAVVDTARFDGATFIGTAQFYEATFTDFASFKDTTFMGDAACSSTHFGWLANFSHTTFAAGSWFSMAVFAHEADFKGASFVGNATFYGTKFEDTADFQPATFKGDAFFANTTFRVGAWFSGTSFAKRAAFGGVDFDDMTTFCDVTFGAVADFKGATFAEGADRPPFARTRVLSPQAAHTWPTGWTVGPKAKSGYLVVQTKEKDQAQDSG